MALIFRDARNLFTLFCKEDYDTFIYSSGQLFISEYSSSTHTPGDTKNDTTVNNIINPLATIKKTYYSMTTLTADEYSYIKSMGKDPVKVYIDSSVDEVTMFSSMLFDIISTPNILQQRSLTNINDVDPKHIRHLLLSSFDLGKIADAYGVTGGEFLTHHKRFGYESVYISNNSGHSYVVFGDMIKGAIKELEPETKFVIEKNNVMILKEVKIKVSMYDKIFVIGWP